MRCAPLCSTLKSPTRSGSRRSGGSGGPILPQAGSKTERKRNKTTGRRGEIGFPEPPCRPVAPSPRRPVAILQNVSTKIFILHDVGQHLAHVSGVHSLAFLFQIRAFERNLVEDFFQDSVQAARA